MGEGAAFHNGFCAASNREWILSMLNRLTESQSSSKSWNTAKIVLLPKRGTEAIRLQELQVGRPVHSCQEKWCSLIILYIRNAFNSVDWNLTVEKLELELKYSRILYWVPYCGMSFLTISFKLSCPQESLSWGMRLI